MLSLFLLVYNNLWNHGPRGEGCILFFSKVSKTMAKRKDHRCSGVVTRCLNPSDVFIDYAPATFPCICITIFTLKKKKTRIAVLKKRHIHSRHPQEVAHNESYFKMQIQLDNLANAHPKFESPTPMQREKVHLLCQNLISRAGAQG